MDLAESDNDCDEPAPKKERYLAVPSSLHAFDRKPRSWSQSYIGPTTVGPDI